MYTLNPDGSLTVVGADPSGATDSAPAIQAAVDWLFSTYGGGTLWLPPGGNYQCRNLTLKGGVMLRSHGRACTTLQSQNADFAVVNLDGTVNYGGLSGLFVVGYTNANATTNAVNVAANVPAVIEDCSIWGGASALNTSGCDGRYRNLFVAGWSFANIVSNGANWFDNVKADTTGDNRPMWGFYQGTPALPGVMENTFSLCDFSGDFSRGSISIQDGGSQTALTRFIGCVASGYVELGGAKHTIFVAQEFGSPAFSHNSGTLNVVASYGFTPTYVASNGVNTNIS
jgi:hypothetical protein